MADLLLDVSIAPVIKFPTWKSELLYSCQVVRILTENDMKGALFSNLAQFNPKGLTKVLFPFKLLFLSPTHCYFLSRLNIYHNPQFSFQFQLMINDIIRNGCPSSSPFSLPSTHLIGNIHIYHPFRIYITQCFRFHRSFCSDEGHSFKTSLPAWFLALS